MLESLVASILNRFLGDYVENFDPKQLNIGIWSGDVKLRNLRLKKESLDKFELPIDVKFGHLGNLTLQIPWSNLKGKPVKVIIEEVYLLASPILQDHYNNEEELKRDLALKLRRLNDLELRERAKPTNNISDEDAAKNESFTDSLVTKIIDNLQVEIKKIHIKYEDIDKVFTDIPYSIGVTLDELSGISTDESWVPTFISTSKSLTHKLLTLKSLCCYWNTDLGSIYSEDPEELLAKFKDSVVNEENCSEFSNFTQFILRPVSGVGHLTVNKAGTTDTQPHIKTDVFFEEFSVDLDSSQYRSALLSASKFHWYNKTHKFKRFKPNVPIKGNGKEWFKYAANSVLSEIHEKNYRWSWDFLKERRDNRKKYIKLWKEKLQLPDFTQKLKDSESNESLRLLEEKLPYDDIKFFRSLAKSELRKETLASSSDTKHKESAPASQPQSGRWFSWWSKDTQPSSENEDKFVITDEQREELYDAIDFDETRAISEAISVPRHHVNFEINANLKRGGFTIKNKLSSSHLAQILFEGCSFQFLQRPDSFLTTFTLQEFKVEDGTESTLYKNVVSVKPIEADTSFSNSEPFFKVSFENNPLDGSADTVLGVKLRSMTIFYHAHFINEIFRFFQPPKDHLDTIYAIMNAAEATVGGIATQTRLGLENILDEHKTVNANFDLQAPLIVLPLDPHSWSSPCAVIDAGHISVISDLADKEKSNEIKNLSPEEYDKISPDELNRLMYDRFNLHLKDTQILIGPTIKSTIEQLHKKGNNPSLILDNLDMKILLELSILPHATNLAKIKTTASLPKFQAKMSDFQYKIFMQLIDKCIPDFGSSDDQDDYDELDSATPLIINNDADTEIEDIQGFDTPPPSSVTADQKKGVQHLFELKFNIGKVELSLRKCTDGLTMSSDPVVDLIAEQFDLDFYKTDTALHVDLALGTFNIEDWVERSGPEEFRKLISSTNFAVDENIDIKKEIFKLSYDRTQRIVHVDNKDIEVFDQDVDLDLSALKVIVTRKSLLTILNFILTTFTDPTATETPADVLRHNDSSEIETSPQQIRVNLDLDSIVLVLNDDGIKLATLQLATAHINVLVLPEKMKVYSKLGALTLHDEVNEGSSRSSFIRKVLSFEGDELAEFTYETYDPTASSEQDYQASFAFKSASLRVNFVEGPLNKILGFLSQFQRMKALFDTARDSAFNQVNIPIQNIKFDVTIGTPIIVFPKLVSSDDDIYDNITVYLGEFKAYNEFIKDTEELVNKISCGLHSARITSEFYLSGSKQFLEIIDNLDIDINVSNHEKSSLDRAKSLITGTSSGFHANLTELQVNYIYLLSERLPSVFVFDENHSLDEIEDAALNANKVIAPNATYGTEQEAILKPTSPSSVVTNPKNVQTDFSFDIPEIAVTIHNNTSDTSSLKDTGISKLSLEKIGATYRQSEDSHYKASFHVKSLTAEDIRRNKNSKFPEIIPKTDSDGYQLSVEVSTDGPSDDKNTIAMVNINNPKVVFDVDYLFALKDFGDKSFAVDKSSIPNDPSSKNNSLNDTTSFNDAVVSDKDTSKPPRKAKFGFTINIIDASLVLLSNPTVDNSEAIVFKIEQLLASKQNIVSASANNVGLFLCNMDQFDDNRIRIIDDFSSSLTIDERGSTPGNFLTSIQASVEPLTMKVSLNDINLALSILNRATELAKQKGGQELNDTAEEGDITYTTFTTDFKRKLSKYVPSIVTSLSGATSKHRIQEDTEIVIKAEDLTADIEGLRLVLIGHVHELPVLDMTLKPFQILAKNWSTDLEADCNIESFVNIFNYARSSWESLVEPWPLDVHVSKSSGENKKFNVDFVSRKLAELTLTSRSVALLSQVLSSISGEHDTKGRGSLKPYKILNQTGFDINVWIDSKEGRPGLELIKDGDEIPWEFQDWRQIREDLNVNRSDYLLGIELLDSNLDQLLNVPVTSEGEEVYSLTPPVDGVHSRLITEIILGDDNVKTIALRSTVTVENATQVPIIIKGNKSYVIQPSNSRSLPINEVYESAYVLKPNIKVPFNWSENTLNWKRLSKGPVSIRCPAEDLDDTTSFYFQAEAKFNKSEPLTRVYPHMKIILSAPLEIENLLPYDISYRLYDRSVKRDWRNFLKRGNVSPVHVVKLEHFLLLSIQPRDSGFAKSDFAIINSPENSEFKRESHLSLKNEDGQSLNLNIHYSTSENRGVGVKVLIYSPYIILNKTAQDLFISEKYNVLQSKVDSSETYKSTTPKMFSFEEDRDVGSRALVRTAKSQWSRPVSFETIGNSTELNIPLPNKRTEVNLGITVSEGEGKYQLSKIVTLAPRFILQNFFTEEIEVMTVGASDSIHLGLGKLEPLYNLPKIDQKQLQIRLLGSNSIWSSPFNIKDVGQIFLKVFKQGVGHILIKVDVVLDNSSLFINIEDAKNEWPFSIRNFSDQEFIFYQKNPYLNENEEETNHDGRPFKPIYYKIPPKSVMPYAWDYPAGLTKELVIRSGGRERYIQLAEIGNLRPMKIPSNGAIVDVNVVADGPTQSLVLSNYDPTSSFYKLQDGVTSSSISVNNSGHFKPETEDSDITTQILFKFEGVGVSLVNTRLQELCYITARGLELHLNDSDIYQTLSWKLKWLQIDNQLFGGIYPIILYPTVVPQSTKEMNNHPAFSGSISKVKDNSHGVVYIKYATTLLQEMSLEIDEDFLFALLEFSKFPGASWNKKKEDRLCDESLSLPEPVSTSHSSDIYFEVLHLQPTQLNLSFVRTERVNAEVKTDSQNAIMFFLNILTMAIGNINDAPIRLNALLIENVRVPIPTLIQHIQTHYGQNFFYQIHKVLGSADVIGNPVGLFNNISSGVMDIFYEPYQGLVMNDRPQELGISVAKGGLSFLKKSVFGFSDSFAKFTGSIAKGLTVATLDKDYQNRRRLNQRRNKPRHALYGFSNGAVSLVESVSSGISGIATAPVIGANEEGASGFFKGIGKGLIGFPTKTAIGIFDLANQVGEGIRNTTTVFDGDGLDKVRLPRYIGHENIVRSFNEREAQGQFWLKTAGGGTYFDDEYLAHVVLPGEDMAVIVTFRRILLISTSTNEVKWSIEFDTIKSITQEKTGIKIGLINSKQGPFIPLPDAESRKFLYRKMGVAVNEYNKLCQVIL